jgi:hypothetical protein
MSEDQAVIATVDEEQYKYDGGLQAGPSMPVVRARTCVISCVSMDLQPSRFALAVKHGQSRRRWRRMRCPVCGLRATVVFQVIERT